MPDAAYWRRWRAEHPEYRERERERSRKRTPEQRRAERERARERKRRERLEDRYRAWVKPWRLANREAFLAQQRRANRRLMERDPERKRRYNREAQKRMAERRYAALAARAVDFIRPDRRTMLHDPLYEDAYAEALLSLYANRTKRNGHYSEDDWVADARAAAVAYVRAERGYRKRMAPLLDDVLAA